MPTLTINKVAGSELLASQDATRVIQTGTIDNIDLEGVSDEDALVRCQQFLEQQGYTWGRALGSLRDDLGYRMLRVKPEPAKFRRVNIELTYETNSFSNTPTVYLLRDRSFSVTQRRCTIPGTREPIIVVYDPQPDPSYFGGKSPQYIADVTFFECDITARSIQLVVLQFGRDDTGTGEYGNYVNSDSWPANQAVFNGTAQPAAGARDKGFWKLQGYSTEYDRNRGMTMITTDALTMNVEDWSVVLMLKNEQTGKYPFASIGGTDPTQRSGIITAMNALEYARGQIYPALPVGPTTPQYGINRWGPYPLTSFEDLFGF